MTKFLCVCEGGTVRSGALAWSLRYQFDQGRVIQASWLKTPQEDLDMLAAWADYIIVLEQKFADKFERFREKVHVLDVGPDVWKNPLDPDLKKIVWERVRGWKSKNWKL